MSSTGCRATRCVAERSFVEAINKKARVLKFDRLEERSAHIDPTNVQIRISAIRHLSDPEIKTGGIGFTIEKIHVLLAHKETRRVDLICAGEAIVVDRYRRGSGRAHRGT